MAKLTHLEGHVLALIWRWQPTTAYFVRNSLERGLATTLSSSPGSVYPIIERLKRRGLVHGVLTDADKRNKEHLSCTEAGVEAVKLWVSTVEPSDLLPEDPWRSRMAFVDCLSPHEQGVWLRSIRGTTEEQLGLLEARSETELIPAVKLAYENARLTLQARLAWINHALVETARADQIKTE